MEKMNNETTTLMIEDAAEYLTEAIPHPFSKYKPYIHNRKCH
jgi:hypothetical protein